METKPMKNVPMNLSMKFLEMKNLKNFNEKSMKQAKDMLNLGLSLLSKNEKFYPTQEHLVLYEILIFCICILTNKKPLTLIFNDHQ